MMEPLVLSFGVLLGYLQQSIKCIQDPRQPSNGTRYRLGDAILAAFSVFFMQCESFLEHQRQMQSRRGKDNAQTLFGLERIPSVPQIRNLLEQIRAQQLFGGVERVHSALQQGGYWYFQLTFVVGFASICQGQSMSVSYKYHRFPIEIIRHCVWLYYTFPLSYRDIEKMMLYRSVEVTYESIRKWCKKFAQTYAHQIRRRRPQPSDKWHLDEVVITIKGQQYYLWRAVDAAGQVLDILMQRHRDQRAAKKFFRKLLKSTVFAPEVIVTDKLRSYGATQKELIPGVEHRQHKGLNNRAENLHRPTRVQERRMGRFKSPGHAQQFLSAFEPIHGYFHPHQHQQTATEYRETMRQRLSDWRQFTRLSVIA